MKPLYYILIFTILLSSCKSKKTLVSSPKTTIELFNDGLPSKETFYGIFSTIDSIKTYYKTGNLKEVFYYNQQGEYHGQCYQLDVNSDLMVTWSFKNGMLIKRTDYKVPTNKNNKVRITDSHKKLLVINKQLKRTPANTNLLFHQAYMRNVLENSLLALDAGLKLIPEENLPIKVKVTLYEMLSDIYASYENEDYSIQYKIKAIEFSEKKERLYYNLGAYFYSINSCNLSEYYLKKVLQV